MDIAVKQEINGSPLPQRQQQQPQQQQQQQQQKQQLQQQQQHGGGGVGGPGPMHGNQGGPVGESPAGKNNMQRNNRNNSKNRQGMGNRGNRGGPGGVGNAGGPGGNAGPGNNRQGNNGQGNPQQGGEESGPPNQHHNRGMNRGHRGHDMDNSFGERRRGGGGEGYFINEKLRMLAGPLLDIPPIEAQEAKFSGRNRLYVGNLTNDVTEVELVDMFKPYGEIHEVFMCKEKNYAFVRVDYLSNAENAKRELDGTMRKNRVLRVRFAPNATAIRVKNLTPYVTNELLYKSFEVFGPLERAVVQVDERGKPTGEGIVEFKNKPGAMAAIRYCTERCYFLTASLRPVIVEPYTYQDDNDGLPEKSLNKKQNEFVKARQQGPRFADHGSFEYEYGQRWKHMHELFKQKAEALKREMIMEEEKLEAQMEYARYEQETEQLREQLRQREMDRDRQKAEWEMKERQVQEARQRNDIQMKTDVEELTNRIKRSDDELHRRQKENNMFMQNQQMTLIDQQQMNDMGGMGVGSGGVGGVGGAGGVGVGGVGGAGVGVGGGNDNRRSFDMMNQSGGNGNFGNMEPTVRDYDHGQNRPSRFDDGPQQQQQQQQQQQMHQQQQQRGNNFGGNRNNWMNNTPERRNNNNNNNNNDDFQNKRRRF